MCSSPILNPRGNVYMLDRANDKGRNDDVVRINLPAKQVPLGAYAGQYQYHGGKGNNLDNRMSLKLDLGGRQSSSLLFKAWYQIEMALTTVGCWSTANPSQAT